MIQTRNAAKPLSSISLILLWVSHFETALALRTREKGWDDSDPPKKWGAMRSRKEVRFGIPLFDRMTGRYRRHLSLREGSEQPPRSGAEKPRFSNPFSSRAPFPLALDDPGSVLAVKGPLRRFAPWTAPGRSEGMAVHEGKEGVRAVWTGRKGTFRAYQDSLAAAEGRCHPQGRSAA